MLSIPAGKVVSLQASAIESVTEEMLEMPTMIGGFSAAMKALHPQVQEFGKRVLQTLANAPKGEKPVRLIDDINIADMAVLKTSLKQALSGVKGLGKTVLIGPLGPESGSSTIIDKALPAQFWWSQAQAEATSCGSKQYAGTLHFTISGSHTIAAVNYLAFIAFLRTRGKTDKGTSSGSTSLSSVSSVSPVQTRTAFRNMDEALAHCS